MIRLHFRVSKYTYPAVDMKALKKNEVEVIVTPSYARDLDVDMHRFDGAVVELDSLGIDSKQWLSEYKDARIISLCSIEENPLLSDKLLDYFKREDSTPTNVVSFARFKEKKNHVARR